MNNNWNKILNELSYKVSSGIPDLSNEQHLMKLWDILKEHNWNIDARVELIKNLNELDFKNKEELKNIIQMKDGKEFDFSGKRVWMLLNIELWMRQHFD